MHYFFQRVFAPESEELSKYIGLFMSTDKHIKVLKLIWWFSSQETKLHLFISSWKMSPCSFFFFLQFGEEQRRLLCAGEAVAFLSWHFVAWTVHVLTDCHFFLILSSAFSVFTVISPLTNQKHILGLLAHGSYSYFICFLPQTPKLYFEVFPVFQLVWKIN